MYRYLSFLWFNLWMATAPESTEQLHQLFVHSNQESARLIAQSTAQMLEEMEEQSSSRYAYKPLYDIARLKDNLLVELERESVNNIRKAVQNIKANIGGTAIFEVIYWYYM